MDIGIDMEVDRKGSELVILLLQDELDRGKEGSPRVDVETDGRSSSEGGVIPSSVCNQSICTKLEESC